MEGRLLAKHRRASKLPRCDDDDLNRKECSTGVECGDRDDDADIECDDDCECMGMLGEEWKLIALYARSKRTKSAMTTPTDLQG